MAPEPKIEASTKPHEHQKFELFCTIIASKMASPNFQNGPKDGLCDYGVKIVFPCTLTFPQIH
jgi:hypothetical protein